MIKYDRNDEVFEWIRSFSRRNGYSPSIREIAEAFNISISTAHRHVVRLEARKLIRTMAWQPRSIRILKWD